MYRTVCMHTYFLHTMIMVCSPVTIRAVLSRCLPCNRLSTRTFFASSTDHTTLVENAVIHRIGDAYGTREYVLVPADIPLELVKKEGKLKLASVYANKNTIFGTKLVTRTLGSMEEVCGSLVDAALEDASSQGQQPQGLAALNGLCDWVMKGIEGKEDIEVLDTLQAKDPVTYEAVVAIATGVPRESHTVVGMGTFRDGQFGWGELAKEFVHRKLGEEAALFESRGGELITIEHLADHSEIYMKSAGGAMAQFFFL